MLLFCPACGNVLVAEEGPRCHRFACTTCPYVRNVTRKVTSRKYPRLKEVDDVLGGAAAWENVDSTAGRAGPRGRAGLAGPCRPLTVPHGLSPPKHAPSASTPAPTSCRSRRARPTSP
ncbi:DNA-directed RNA polymerase III subunit RPC10 isoform X1 [Onychostruthus taczanowskii]|uniref:DNA-directed RNA polymerase III subunit RPC10 isoform X1 n=1 Tax=Onychostruthus taczanowskii TaxID=356909 RepID=UPI001B80821B|nr:DNA-directed RNA polymerase III subunit RPC10 isoform X1 [Onychostruthus taczanowskii]